MKKYILFRLLGAPIPISDGRLLALTGRTQQHYGVINII